MKIKNFLYLSILICLSFSLAAEENWELSRDEVAEIAQHREASRRLGDLTTIKEAKLALVGGHVDKAIVLLKRLNLKDSPVEIIVKRYLATAYFIKGDYQNSFETLSDKRFNQVQYFPQICLLRTLNLMALGKSTEAYRENTTCNTATFDYSPTQHLWTDHIMELITLDRSDREQKITQTKTMKSVDLVRVNNETVRIWLKMGLYLNREDILIKEFKNIPEDSYSSQKIRELMGFIYYRTGDTEKALSFIEDLLTPNSENIKGNINLEKKEYELAFGHFKLALKQKENSQNAIERAIPLAWILDQWEDGTELISKYRDQTVPERNKNTLDTAFQIKLKRLERAERQLEFLRQEFNNKPPREILQMETYVSTMLSRQEQLEKVATETCRKQDGLACYVLMQTMIWEDLGRLSARPEKTYTDSELNIKNLKEKSEANPLKEEVLVDQRDIEELDDAELGIRVK